MSDEIWKTITEFPLYEVSTFGRVRTKKTGYTRIGHNNGGGYLQLLFCPGKKQRTVHRLVAKSFIPNPHNKPEIDHIDGNKQNNHVSNLRWSTSAENHHNPITMKRYLEAKNRAPRIPNVNPNIYGRYRLSMRYNGRKLSFGTYATAEAHRAAYLICWYIKNRQQDLPIILQEYADVIQTNMNDFAKLRAIWSNHGHTIQGLGGRGLA